MAVPAGPRVHGAPIRPTSHTSGARRFSSRCLPGRRVVEHERCSGLERVHAVQQLRLRLREPPAVSRSVSLTMNSMADRALSGASGNSGIIIAQFLNALAIACADRETMTTREFGKAPQHAAAQTYSAIDNPREGTPISVFRIWSDDLSRLGEPANDFREVFSHTSMRRGSRSSVRRISCRCSRTPASSTQEPRVLCRSWKAWPG